MWGLLEVRGLLMTDGHTGMVNQTQQREEGVFLFHTGSGDRKGQGCVPHCIIPMLFILLFFSLWAAIQAGQLQHKRAGVQSRQKAWLSIRGLLH